MTRELNGLELQGFIKERQLKQVRNLRQEHHVTLILLILMGEDASDASSVYVRMKSQYAEDIGIAVNVEVVAEDMMRQRINEANVDPIVQGIIVQLPLTSLELTDAICNAIAPEKDVDGLGAEANYPSATADAISWLCSGYGVDLESKSIAVVGQGKLVGKPLADMWRASGYTVTTIDVTTPNRSDILRSSDVIVSAAGVPRLIVSDDVKDGAVVVDAGTTSENGTLVGDVDDSVRERLDVSITPKKGGVGPLTIALLFDHLIQAGYVTTKQ